MDADARFFYRWTDSDGWTVHIKNEFKRTDEWNSSTDGRIWTAGRDKLSTSWTRTDADAGIFSQMDGSGRPDGWTNFVRGGLVRVMSSPHCVLTLSNGDVF